MWSRFKLGLRPPNPARYARVKAFHPSLLPIDPLESTTPRDWAKGCPWDDDVLDNDVLGDCGPAAAVNWLKLMALVCGRDRLLFTVDDALEAYRRLGYDGTPATDNGVVLLDLMELWQSEGIGGFKLDCFFRIDHLDPVHLATAVAVGGPLIVGATLSETCLTTDTWGDACAQDTRIAGGHAILYMSDSPGGGNAKSWGCAVFNTASFRIRRWDEAYLPVCRDLCPPGVDVERLITLAGQL